MENGLHRIVKLMLYCFTTAAKQWALLMIMVFFYVNVLGYDAAAMAVSFSLLVTLIMSMQNITITFKYTVGFGSTRKNFFLMGLLNKLLYAGLFNLVACAVILLYESVPFNILPAMFLLFAVSTLAGVMGEFFGVLMYKSVVLGFTVYMISILVFVFSVIGILLYSVNSGNGANFTDWLYSDTVILGVTGICTVIAVLFSLINWNMLKKIEIKS